jgi:hypothetical protein
MKSLIAFLGAEVRDPRPAIEDPGSVPYPAFRLKGVGVDGNFERRYWHFVHGGFFKAVRLTALLHGCAGTQVALYCGVRPRVRGNFFDHSPTPGKLRFRSRFPLPVVLRHPARSAVSAEPKPGR